jgi:hypothetical protein
MNESNIGRKGRIELGIWLGGTCTIHETEEFSLKVNID